MFCMTHQRLCWSWIHVSRLPGIRKTRLWKGTGLSVTDAAKPAPSPIVIWLAYEAIACMRFPRFPWIHKLLLHRNTTATLAHMYT